METENRPTPTATRGPSSDAKWVIGILAPLMFGIGGLLWSQNNAINSRLDQIGSDIRRMSDRLRAVEIDFAQIEQRLATLERLHLPGAARPPRLDGPAPGESGHDSLSPAGNRRPSLPCGTGTAARDECPVLLAPEKLFLYPVVESRMLRGGL